MNLDNIENIAKQLNINSKEEAEESNLELKFKQLSLDNKRNELNSELIKLYEILTMVSNNKGINIVQKKLNNYELSNNNLISESEYLDLQYSNLLKFREIFVDYISWNE